VSSDTERKDRQGNPVPFQQKKKEAAGVATGSHIKP